MASDFPSSSAIGRREILGALTAGAVGGLSVAIVEQLDRGEDRPARVSTRESTQGPSVSVTDHGARADGRTDCTAAFQSAIDSLAVGGGTVWIPSAEFPYILKSPVHLNRPGVSIDGGSPIVSGTIVVGDAKAAQTMKSSIQNIRFSYEDLAKGSTFIECDRVRQFRVSNCFFSGAERCIYFRPTVIQNAHENSMWSISDNQFANCDYAWYVDKNDASVWGATADSMFTQNIVNVSYVTAVHIEAIDGAQITNNVFFSLNWNSGNQRKAEKRQNIYIGESNWLHIQGNNLFEAGRESILLERVRVAEISGNLIAWPGQLRPSDAVSVSSADEGMQLSVSGNAIASYTASAVKIDGHVISAVLGSNSVSFLPSTKTYLGSSSLDGIPHFRYHLADSLSGNLPNIQDDVSVSAGQVDHFPGTARTRSIRAKGLWAAETTAENEIAVPAGDSRTLFEMSGYGVGTSDAFTGMIVLSSRESISSVTRTDVITVGRSNGLTVMNLLSSAAAPNEGAQSFSYHADGSLLLVRAPASAAISVRVTAISTGNLSLA